MSAVSLPIAWRGLNAGSCTPLPRLVCPQPRLAYCHLRECRFYQAGRLDRPRRPPSVQSPFAQLGCYLRWGDVIRLLRGHYSSVFARTGSSAAPVGLSHPSAFGLVWRVLAGCYQSLLPTAASRRYLQQSVLGCWIPYPGGTPCALTCFFHDVVGLPQDTMGRLPASVPRITTSRRVVFRGCRYFVMFRPPSLLTPQIVPTAAILPQGSRGFYVRAYRALLPPHAPDMLTVRRQVIDGTGTCTLLDSQPCRLLQCLDHLFVFNELTLRRAISSYIAYYNHHRSIGQRAPCASGRAADGPAGMRRSVVAEPVLGGLHHIYRRAS